MPTFTSTERAVCDKLAHDSSGLLSPARMIKGQIMNQISNAKSALRNYVASDDATINAAKDALNNNVNNSLPDTNDIDRMIQIINNCLFLKDDDALRNPIALGNALAKSVADKIADYIDDVTSVPEFLVGKILSLLDEILGNALPGSKALSDLLKKMDKLIQCLSQFCNGEYTSEVISLTNETEGLYNDMYMVSDPNDPNYGKLDKDRLFTETGKSASDIAKITDVTDFVDGVKANGKKSVDDFVTAAKNAKKLGGLF